MSGPLADLSDSVQDSRKSTVPGRRSEPLRIPLERLRMPRNIPAGMSLFRIAAIADTLRNGGEVGEPALIRREGPGQWSITDGKHRYVASYVAGMPDLLCVEEP